MTESDTHARTTTLQPELDERLAALEASVEKIEAHLQTLTDRRDEAAPDALLGEREAAQRLHLTCSALRRMRREQRGPRWRRIGSRSVRYSAHDLEEYIGAGAQNTTDSARRPKFGRRA